MTTEASRPLRLIHTSDWHIGQELHGHDRAEEHDAFLVWLSEQLVALEADALIVTGDIFDVANPPISAMARFYRFLRDATERCPTLEIVVIGGNHDSAARINLPGALLGKGRVHLIGQVPRREGLLDLEALLVPLTNRMGKMAAWLAAVPYCRPGDLGKGDLASLYNEVTDAGLTRAEGLPLVLTGHLHVAGGDLSIESERRIVIGGEEAQASSLFDARTAYVALGHLHRPQAIAGETFIRYAGSPFPMSVSERHYRHSISVVDLGPADVTVSEVQVPRVAQFLIFPSEGAVCLDEVERQIGSFDFGHAKSPGGMPFVEVAVLLDRPEPGVTARVQAALDGKPVRLTRVRSVYPEGKIAGGIAPGQDMLDAILPDAVFAELHTQRHAGLPLVCRRIEEAKGRIIRGWVNMRELAFGIVRKPDQLWPHDADVRKIAKAVADFQGKPGELGSDFPGPPGALLSTVQSPHDKSRPYPTHRGALRFDGERAPIHQMQVP